MSIRFAADRRALRFPSTCGILSRSSRVFEAPFLSTRKVPYLLKKPRKEAKHVRTSFSPVQTTCRPSIPLRNVYPRPLSKEPNLVEGFQNAGYPTFSTFYLHLCLFLPSRMSRLRTYSSISLKLRKTIGISRRNLRLRYLRHVFCL